MNIIEPYIEVENYDGKKIMKNIERACRTCFVEGTEILTDKGWMKIENIKNEKILTYNAKLNKYQYNENNLLVKDYDGDILECTYFNTNFKITPEHRLYCSKPGKREYEFKNADVALQKTIRIPKWFIDCKGLDNEEYNPIITHTVTMGKGGNGWHRDVEKEVSFKVTDDVLILIGAYISEGHINHIEPYLQDEARTKKCGVNVCITQIENKPLYKKVISALDNLKLSYKIDKDPRKPYIRWIKILGGVPMANWFIYECGRGSKNVHLPIWFRKLSVRQLNVLKEILYDGDGSHATTRHESYLSSSSSLLDDMQELHILLGKSATKGDHYVLENARDSCKINPNKHIRYVKYKGKVYCTSTNNGIVCIRYNNKTVWIGNCYRSEGKITDDSYKKLIKNCLTRGHESPLEHEKITVRLTCDIGCYDDKTYVLTDDGWKLFKDVSVRNDKVYTLDDDNNVVLSKITASVKKEYKGKMYEFKNKNLDLCVTPDHNMWVNRGRKWRWVEAEKLLKSKKYKFYRGTRDVENLAPDRFLTMYRQVTDAGLKSEEETKSGKLVGFNLNEILGENEENAFRFLALFYVCGLIWQFNNVFTIEFISYGKKDLKYCHEILDAIGLKHRNVSDFITLVEDQDLLGKWLNSFFLTDDKSLLSGDIIDNPSKKKVPDELLNINKENLNLFFKEYLRLKPLAGNSCSGDRGIIRYLSKEEAEGLGKICDVLGYGYKIRPMKEKDYYILYVRYTQNSRQTVVFSGQPNIIDYDGYVYCLTIPRYHRLFVKRNNKTCWCGNCYKDLTRHRFASFSIESSRYCCYSKDRFDGQIKFIKPWFYKSSWSEANYEGRAMTDEEIKSKIWETTMQEIEDNYIQMSDSKAKTDELRMLLPHSTAAEVTMTANIREWRHILSLRASFRAHPSVQQVMIPLLLKFKEDMPELFEDIDYNTDFPPEKYAKVSIMKD